MNQSWNLLFSSLTTWSSAMGSRFGNPRTMPRPTGSRSFARRLYPLDLPTDRIRPPQKTYSSTREDAIWDADFTSRLRKGAAKLGFTLQNYLLAAFGVLMHRLAGQEDLVIGIPTAGQISPVVTSVPGHRALVGHCVNTLPLRLLCSGKMPFREFLKTVKGANAGRV